MAEAYYVDFVNESGRTWIMGVFQTLPDSLGLEGETAMPGIGMSDQGSVYQRELVSGMAAQFTVKPTYWVGLFNQLVLGEVVSSNVTVGPEKLQFGEGQNLATVTTRDDGEKLKMEIKYGHMTALSIAYNSSP